MADQDRQTDRLRDRQTKDTDTDALYNDDIKKLINLIKNLKIT